MMLDLWIKLLLPVSFKSKSQIEVDASFMHDIKSASRELIVVSQNKRVKTLCNVKGSNRQPSSAGWAWFIS